MKKLFVIALGIAVLLGMGAGPAAADPIASYGDMNPDHELIDFESIPAWTPTPFTTQGVTFSSAWAPHEQSVRPWHHYPSLPGLFGGHALGHDYPPISMEFDTPVQEVGMGVFDSDWTVSSLQIYDEDDTLLETIWVPQGYAVFVGCVRPQPDIKRVVFMPCYSMGGCEISSIDMVRFYRPETPPDADEDGIPDNEDNCPDTPNEDQADNDQDGAGDACDDDDDNDGVLDEDDNCPMTANNDQADFDGDDAGDLCDEDDDNDGIPDADDAYPTSDVSQTVSIDGFESGVANHQFDDGSTFADLIGSAAAQAEDHDEFVSAVSKLTNQWKKAGLISGKEKGKITSAAARSDLP